MSARRVYVGNLPEDVRKSELEDLFQDFKPDEINLPRQSHGFAFLIFDDPRDADDAIIDMDGARFCGRRIRVEQAGKFAGGGGGSRYSRGDGRGYDRGYYRDSSPRYRRERSRPAGRYRLLLEDLPRDASWQDLKRISDFFRAVSLLSRIRRLLKWYDFARENGCPPPLNTDVTFRDGNTIGLLEFDSRMELDEAIRTLDNQKIIPGRGARHQYDPTPVRAIEDDVISRSPSRSLYRSRSRRYRSYSRRRSRSRSRSRRRSLSRRDSRD